MFLGHLMLARWPFPCPVHMLMMVLLLDMLGRLRCLLFIHRYKENVQYLTHITPYRNGKQE